MTTFGEKLAAAREARPTKDVTVILDAEIAQEKARLTQELETADDEPRLGAKTEADKIREQLDALDDATDAVVTLRFTRIPGRYWAELTSKNPVRVDVPIDRHYGYNFDAVCEAAARFTDNSGRSYGQRVEGDEVVPMTDDEWNELYDVLSGNEVSEIRDAIWSLNEWDPQQRVNELVLRSGAATRSVKK